MFLMQLFKEISEMVPERILSTVITMLSGLTFIACEHGPGGPMGNYGHMMDYGYGGGFMWLIILALAGVAIYFLFQASKSKGSGGSGGTVVDTPLDILKKRYAKGEIDKEEFESRKKDLES
jgi:putative membrane protein